MICNYEGIKLSNDIFYTAHSPFNAYTQELWL